MLLHYPFACATSEITIVGWCELWYVLKLKVFSLQAELSQCFINNDYNCLIVLAGPIMRWQMMLRLCGPLLFFHKQ